MLEDGAGWRMEEGAVIVTENGNQLQRKQWGMTDGAGALIKGAFCNKLGNQKRTDTLLDWNQTVQCNRINRRNMEVWRIKLLSFWPEQVMS